MSIAIAPVATAIASMERRGGAPAFGGPRRRNAAATNESLVEHAADSVPAPAATHGAELVSVLPGTLFTATLMAQRLSDRPAPPTAAAGRDWQPPASSLKLKDTLA